MSDEDYRGPATLAFDDAEITTQVRLSVRFEPVEGRYRWAGRTGPDDDLVARVTGGQTTAILTIDGVRATARLGDPDPWGGVRLTGVGRPPWAGTADPR